jgi:large subunit ribosomal protein L27
MAHKKAQWSTNNGRDSNAKRLWVKVFGGLEVRSGNIILRQKWNKFWPGTGVSQGKDFTLFAVKEWVVSFSEKRRVRFDGRIFKDIYVSVK